MKQWVLGLVVLSVLASPVRAAGDPDAGQQVFKKCRACHSVGDNAENRIGPILNDVVGRPAGAEAGFRYSDPMRTAAAKGLVWTPETLGKWLANPREFIPGTQMSFAGLTAPEDIDNVIAYLMTMSPDYVPADASAASTPAPE